MPACPRLPLDELSFLPTVVRIRSRRRRYAHACAHVLLYIVCLLYATLPKLPILPVLSTLFRPFGVFPVQRSVLSAILASCQRFWRAVNDFSAPRWYTPNPRSRSAAYVSQYHAALRQGGTGHPRAAQGLITPQATSNMCNHVTHT